MDTNQKNEIAKLEEKILKAISSTQIFSNKCSVTLKGKSLNGHNVTQTIKFKLVPIDFTLTRGTSHE